LFSIILSPLDKKILVRVRVYTKGGIDFFYMAEKVIIFLQQTRFRPGQVKKGVIHGNTWLSGPTINGKLRVVGPGQYPGHRYLRNIPGTSPSGLSG
jgi:hypothetical protein